MKFYIQAESAIEIFRLQFDLITFKKIEDQEISESDYITNDVLETIIIQRKIIDSNQIGFSFDNNNSNGDDNLKFQVLVKRKFFPIIPSKEQLISVIQEGNDFIKNILVLNIYGFFELRYSSLVRSKFIDASIIVRSEPFCEGIGNVGVNASHNSKLINELYLSFINYWVDHLKTGRTNYFTDDEERISMTNNINSILDETIHLRNALQEKDGNYIYNDY